MLVLASLISVAFLRADLQTPRTPPQKTLADYMAAHPWDATKNGPLVVLEPDKVKSKNGSDDLAAFDRKLVAVGHMHAYVPRTMVLIDDSLSQSPNLYEGLPPDAKMLYLLRSLSDDQFAKLSNSSLGLDDLQGEQRLVFRSLVPKPLSWTSCLVDNNGMFGKEQGKGTLTDDELLRVRLKVQRYVDFRVYLSQPPNSYSEFGSDRYRGTPGSLFTQRDIGTQSPDTAFGLRIRSEVDNQPKRSDLDGMALNASVSVPRTATVRDLLQLVGAKCHLILIPDFRIADRAVKVLGDSLGAGDLLRAIAETATGTYRRVGGVYVLTSDLTGMGYRKLRISAWEDTLQNEVWKHEEVWRHEIGSRSGFGQLSFGGGATAPSGDLLKTIEKADSSPGGSIDVTSEDLSADLRRLLDQWDHEYTEQPIRKDKLGVASNLYYSFLLPDGTQLQPEGSIGRRTDFLPSQVFEPQKTPPASFPIELPKDTPLELAVRCESGDLASLIAHCAEHHAKKIWLETNDPATLKSAVDAGIAARVEVGLLARPWSLRQSGDGPDRTLFGERGAEVSVRVANSGRWTSWLDSQKVTVPEYSALLTPSDGAVVLRWRHIEALAQTKGLSGVTLIETEPPGYEPKRDTWQSALGPLEWEIVGNGYSVEQRTEFLKSHEVDPIDVAGQGYWTTAELRQPFFVDNNLQAIPSDSDDLPAENPKVPTMLPAWRSYLAAKNNEAILQLVSALGQPVFVNVRQKLVNTMPGWMIAVSTWRPGQPLPSSAGQQTSMFDPGLGGMILLSCPADPMSPIGQYRGLMLSWMNHPPPNEKHKLSDMVTVFDFSQTPIEAVGPELDRWFSVPTADSKVR